VIPGAPVPIPDHDTRSFWEACHEGKFLIPQCRSCKTLRWPPGPVCPSCRSDETEWVSASGRGRVYSWVVARHPANPTMADAVPYIVGLIELDEGVRVVGNVCECDPADVEPDLAVELFFEEAADGLRLPNFRRAAE